MTNLSRARLIAILVPNALLWGAIASQYLGHLHPCEMCLWQRWPHLAAILLALGAILLRRTPGPSRALTALAALAILASGAIGLFHAGVEQGWWHGVTTCAAPPVSGSPQDVLAQIMAAPIVRCDQIQWSLLGLSLAAWNALLSILSGSVILWLISKSR
ncbi:disulfide bond formation protein B [Sphingomonas morindae]|uniref:Disulfide bond formation protein B n=1 Tax=Sphingomonas morindae TaxID=1541170 RepID=A0ABY4X580_9SPHN|nr:disulfide bond formation protein B [Sphingomonas morindae]USI72053.1 disulfide bond formation protein B [Sphingomonas morindae]